MNVFSYLMAKKGYKVGNDLFSYLLGNKGGLPPEYQQLEYIENSGTQYIDTGIIPSKNGRIEIKFMDTVASGSFYGTGARKSTSATVYSGVIGSSISQNIFVSPSNIATSDFYREINKIYEIKAEYNSEKTGEGTIKCLTSGDTFSGKQSGILPDDYLVNILLFAVRSGQITSGMRLYYYKIWKDGEIVRDFIPCYRVADNVAGLYDKVSGTFFTNAGSGDFIIPSDN